MVKKQDKPEVHDYNKRKQNRFKVESKKWE